MESPTTKPLKAGSTKFWKQLRVNLLWKLGLFFGLIGFIVSLLSAFVILNNLLMFPGDIVWYLSNPPSLFLLLKDFTPLCASIGVICISIAGLRSSEKK